MSQKANIFSTTFFLLVNRRHTSRDENKGIVYREIFVHWSFFIFEQPFGLLISYEKRFSFYIKCAKMFRKGIKKNFAFFNARVNNCTRRVLYLLYMTRDWGSNNFDVKYFQTCCSPLTSRGSPSYKFNPDIKRGVYDFQATNRKQVGF